MLPKDLARLVPKSHLMTENEWRAIGVQQSRGWVSSIKDVFLARIFYLMFWNFLGSLHDPPTGAPCPALPQVNGQ